MYFDHINFPPLHLPIHPSMSVVGFCLFLSVSLKVVTNCGSKNLFCPLFLQDPLGMECDRHIPFRAKHSTI